MCIHSTRYILHVIKDRVNSFYQILPLSPTYKTCRQAENMAYSYSDSQWIQQAVLSRLPLLKAVFPEPLVIHWCTGGRVFDVRLKREQMNWLICANPHTWTRAEESGQQRLPMAFLRNSPNSWIFGPVHLHVLAAIEQVHSPYLCPMHIYIHRTITPKKQTYSSPPSQKTYYPCQMTMNPSHFF